MARIVKEYDERYTEFLAVAQDLFYRKGYEQTSVQEIINTLGVAKGTFYHYFASKAELLNALVEHQYLQTVAALEPIVADDGQSAVEKFTSLFAHIGTWKTANRDLLMDALRMFYQDENLRLRNTMMAQSNAVVAPLLAQIIRQGVAESVFDVDYPDEVAEIVLTMGLACSEAISTLLLAGTWDETAIHSIECKLLVYQRSIERVLGAEQDALQLIDPDILNIWLPNNETGTQQ
jgi:AcrR family transcriptional regulator